MNANNNEKQNRQQLEQMLKNEYGKEYQIEKDQEINVDDKSIASSEKETYHGNNGDLSITWEDEDINVDYIISSKIDKEKKLFLMYKEDSASISDVVDLKYLKQYKFPKLKKHEYMIFCSGPSDEVNEQLAAALGVHYYKEYGNLEKGLRKILS